MGLGFTLITALCLAAVALTALVVLFSSGDTTRSIDDVYARREAAQPPEARRAPGTDEPETLGGRRRETAGTSAGRSDVAQSQREAA